MFEFRVEKDVKITSGFKFKLTILLVFLIFTLLHTNVENGFESYANAILKVVLSFTCQC